MTRPAKLLLGSVITLLVIAAIVVATFVVTQVNRTTTSVGKEPAFMENSEARAQLAGMSQVSSAKQAANNTGHSILSGSQLSSERLLSTWVTPNGDEVMEVYESGLTIVSEEPEIGSDPLKYYEAVVADANRSSVYITEINGVPALAVEPNTDKLGSNPGLIRFASHGMSVIVSGKDLSVEYLIRIAEQLETVEKAAVGP